MWIEVSIDLVEDMCSEDTLIFLKNVGYFDLFVAI